MASPLLRTTFPPWKRQWCLQVSLFDTFVCTVVSSVFTTESFQSYDCCHVHNAKATSSSKDTPMGSNGVYDRLLSRKQLSNSTTVSGLCSPARHALLTMKWQLTCARGRALRVDWCGRKTSAFPGVNRLDKMHMPLFPNINDQSCWETLTLSVQPCCWNKERHFKFVILIL